MIRDQKFALVTGCGRGGIGEALVTEYTRRNICAIATLLPNEASDHLSDAGINFFRLDVTNETSIIDLKAAIKKLTGGHGLDILVNCAGIAYTMPAIDTDVKAVQRMFDINLFGPMRMVHHFHDMLIHAEGTIVNIGSIGGVIPFLYGSSYNASKAALHHWGNTLRCELAPLNVKVITVISGEVSTNILKNDAHRRLPEGSYYSALSESFHQHVVRTPSMKDSEPFLPSVLQRFHPLYKSPLSSPSPWGGTGELTRLPTQENATNRFDYASHVVAESLRASPSPWFWYGSFTLATRLIDMFCWRSVWDTLMWNMFGLGALKEAHSRNNKKTT